MATCGPSNAFQNLKNHVQRDASLQREGVVTDPRQLSFRPQRNDDSTAQFDEFNRFEPRHAEFNSPMYLSGPDLMPNIGMPSPARDVGYINPPFKSDLTHDSRFQGSGANASDSWASEFNSRQNDGQFQPSINNHFKSSQYGMPQYGSPQYGTPQYVKPQFGPQFGRQFGAQINHQTSNIPENFVQTDPMSVAMESAFAEAEENFKQLKLQESRNEETKISDAQGRRNDASAVAAGIIESVNKSSDPDLSSKVQSSKFMSLMNKLKNNEVTIEEKNIIDTETSVEVDVHELEPAPTAGISSSSDDSTKKTSHDWAPQRPVMTREQPPETREETKRHYRFSRDLDDPDTYIRKLRMNLDPRLFRKSPYESPLEKAKELAPQAVNAGSWEEKYEDW